MQHASFCLRKPFLDFLDDYSMNNIVRTTTGSTRVAHQSELKILDEPNLTFRPELFMPLAMLT